MDKDRHGLGRAAKRLLGALALVATWSGAANAAATGPWSENEYGAVRLVAAAEGVGKGSQVRLGIEFRMAKGWKIYWRSPGDAGFPPRFDWSASDNLAEALVRWPRPERFSAVGFETVGYSDEVILPVEALLARPGEAAELRARVEYLSCEEICVPLDADVALGLPAGPATPSEHAHRIARFAARVPGPPSASGMAIESLTFEEGASPRLVVTATAEEPFRAPDLLVEGPRELAFSRPEVRFGDGGHQATLSVAVDGLAYLERPLAGERVTLTLFDGDRAAEAEAVVAAGVARAAGDRSLAAILGLALLGGLILNLMPCVLPVLSIKLLGVVRQGGRTRAEVRAGFIASAGGILFSFLVLAGVLIALKLTGAAVGWGIQFQQPWFVIAMTVIVVAFACNLWGLFDIRLPGWAGSLGASRGDGLAGHFAGGAFATLLATPCSAPFLGTAVGFALARGPGEIAAVFAALGLGLAAPYLAVAALPGLAARLPRPGPWMVVLQRLLGAALIATAAWLLSVLAAQSGLAVAAFAAAMVGLMALAFAVRRRAAERFRAAASAAVAASMLAAFAAPAVQGATAPAALDGLWRPFEESAIAGLVDSGKVVFVDVTAAWCITCRVNKKVAFSDDVRGRLAGDGVVAMQADWTRPVPEISRYLARYGRYGIPFNIVYGPGAPQGLPLPELLTPAAVRDALEEAARRPS